LTVLPVSVEVHLSAYDWIRDHSEPHPKKRNRAIVQAASFPQTNPYFCRTFSETWKYKAMFFLGKSEIGQQSDVAEAMARP
jgi:hypothetical protein